MDSLTSASVGALPFVAMSAPRRFLDARRLRTPATGRERIDRRLASSRRKRRTGPKFPTPKEEQKGVVEGFFDWAALTIVQSGLVYSGPNTSYCGLTFCHVAIKTISDLNRTLGP